MDTADAPRPRRGERAPDTHERQGDGRAPGAYELRRGERAPGAYELRRGGYSVGVHPIGGTLTHLRWRDRDLVAPCAAPPAADFRGALLAPWPNRVAHAYYEWAGRTHRLEANEAERGHALHGLVWARPFSARVVGEANLVLETSLTDAPGYPFALDFELRVELGADGLACDLIATNVGTGTAPYGCGFHPYLLPATGQVSGAQVCLPARSRLATDAGMVPTRLGPVPPGADFRRPRRLPDAGLDHSYTGLDFDADGLARVTVTDADGAGARLSLTAATPWVHLYAPASERAGVAVEPMTCPPDAFRRGRALALEPGARHGAGWRIEAVGSR